MDFKGIKQRGASQSDWVQTDFGAKYAMIAVVDGYTKHRVSTFVTPATARKIAVELIRLTDEMEGK
jgi:hypothetical protein